MSYSNEGYQPKDRSGVVGSDVELQARINNLIYLALEGLSKDLGKDVVGIITEDYINQLKELTNW
jgi:hypothetical protein